MAEYTVYLHNVPRVGEDGKSIPIAPHQTEEFSKLKDAQKLAVENKDKFERVVVMDTSGDKPKLVERFIDGEHVVAEKEEEEPEAEDAQEEVTN
jgi:hypothetical protein